MIVLDYICRKCGKQEERFLDSGESRIQKCESCGEEMEYQYPAPKGYVPGSGNPCRQ